MRNRSKKRRWWVWPVGLVVAAFLTVGILTRMSSDRLATEIERARKVGLYATRADFLAALPPDSENALLVMEDASRELAALPKFERSLLVNTPELMEPGPSRASATKTYLGRSNLATWQEVRSAARVAKPVFDRLEAAGKLPGFARKDTQEFGALAQNKELVKALCGSAMAEANLGDFESAARFLRVARRVAELHYQEPTAIAMLVGVAVEAIVLANARKITLLAAKNDSHLDVMRRYWAEDYAAPDMRTVVKGEAFLSVEGVDLAAKDPAMVFLQEDKKTLEYWRNETVKLSWMRNAVKSKLLALATEIYPGLPEDPYALRKTFDHFQLWESRFAADTSTSGHVAQAVILGFSLYEPSMSNALVGRRLGRAFAELLAEKNRAGAFPPSLPKSISAIIDPYSGRAFLYRTTASGFVIYSVGKNGVDDGGDGIPKSADITLTYDGSVRFTY